MHRLRRLPIFTALHARHHYLPVAWAMCFGVGFSLTVFLVVRWWETQNIEKMFRLAAQDRAAAVRGAFDVEVGMLELIRSSLIGDGRIEGEEFRDILKPFHAHNRSIESVQWVPRVRDDQRRRFEAKARIDGPKDFEITESDQHGHMVRAKQREEYYPIQMVGPRACDRSVLGYDLASEPTRLESLLWSRASGKTLASGRIAFVEDKAADGFLVYMPVYMKGKSAGTVLDRRKNLLGFLIGVFRPNEMLATALRKLQPEGIDVCLYDPSLPPDKQPFHFHASRTRQEGTSTSNLAEKIESGGMQYVEPLGLAGHPWTIVCLPTPDFIAVRRTWWSWGVMAAGLAFTILSAAYLRLSIDRRTNAERSRDERHRYAQELEEKVREQTSDIRRAQEEVIYRLVSASQWRDEETGMHIRRTGLLSEVLARAAGWSSSEADVIRQAAPMHDVGKIGIPDAVLRKPGTLTPEEFEVMKTHTLIGAEMLSHSDVPILQMAREIALNHHERWDGCGYPNGTSGQQIPECARILAIVDVYDALTHDRVYRSAMPEEEVLEIMREGAGSHFDPLLLSYFFLHIAEIRKLSRQHPDDAYEAKMSSGIWSSVMSSLSEDGDHHEDDGVLAYAADE